MVTVIRYLGTYLKNERHVRTLELLFSGFNRRGWTSILVLEREPDEKEWIEKIERYNVKLVYAKRAKGNYDIDVIRNVYAMCKKYSCDIFHCDNIHTSPLIGAMLARVKIRMWSKRSMNHATELCKKLTIRDLLSPSVRLSSFCATHIHCVSSRVRKELIDLKVGKNKAFVLVNPLPDEVNIKITREKARALYGYSDEDIVFVTIGHSVRVKAWDILIDAFVESAAASQRTKLLLVGSTNAANEQEILNYIKEKIHKNNVMDRVFFAGYVKDIGVPLKAADVFILPSRSEGSSNALLEALSYGLPCIATRVGNSEDVIIHEKNGYLVDVEDHKSLSKYITILSRDTEIINSMSKQELNNYKYKTKEEYTSRFAEIYQLIYEGKTGLEIGS
jgi:glycosyltransferase involved in cell wall biosynthesis